VFAPPAEELLETVTIDDDWLLITIVMLDDE